MPDNEPLINLALLNGAAAFVFAGLLAFTLTPLVRVLAFRIGAVDVPLDDRRMHTVPVPRLGGLAVFVAFVAGVLLFTKPSAAIIAALGGSIIIIAGGIVDDIWKIRAIFKFLFQIAAAAIVISQGVVIERVSIFGEYLHFGVFSIPITFLWIVGLTNAVNFLDGLDGLTCGISTISAVCLFFVSVIVGDPAVVMLTAILGGACIGFLPYNRATGAEVNSTAKIFIGETGAAFLGFILSVIAIQGLFKVHAVLTFLAPFLILGVPIFDTTFAIIRRLLSGRAPYSADRGHIHHRLIDLGFTQRQSVHILYAVSSLLGISAIMLTMQMIWQALVVLIVSMAIAALTWIVISNKKTRSQSGLTDEREDEEDTL